MAEAVLRRMVRGVSTREYANVIDLTRDGFGVQKSSVSRDFVRASAAKSRRWRNARSSRPWRNPPEHDGLESSEASREKVRRNHFPS